ncbi:hypothetical protein JavanS250_0014 [Streptococcus satellite phage Javan250]|uniref:hypothetical protein n=1 Tax=Streptococcus halotolerans TaxID=1814128 RepID=UPI000AEDCF34|nr:hypothetical protein [Streptococcus halotolerans]QBX08347.1 hypothetical protein JavanS250_0014 [Streptococcus satellite phage Javan250]
MAQELTTDLLRSYGADGTDIAMITDYFEGRLSKEEIESYLAMTSEEQIAYIENYKARG